ncbi:helix-turn-helix domain-containing protein [Streptosporangium canum]|uniref:helix-turn-helix domain-containing protein n=1 Tax=Streptosporangium canum TaxID=324952 RepID=UPI00343A0D07
MPRPPVLPANDKLAIVLPVLSGQRTIAEAARGAQGSEQSTVNRRKQFIEGGRIGLEGALTNRASEREEDLMAEVKRLKTVLGEVYVELSAWRKVSPHRRVPARTSR